TPERIRIRHPLVRGLVRRTRPLRAVSRRSAPGAGANVRREVVSTAVGTIEELLAEAAGALAPSLQGEHVLASAPAAGHPFVAAALAVATGAPVLAVAPDPRSAQTLADGAAAWLGGGPAVRGGIVDVFPATARRPVRAELLGDEIESVREFAPGTQLSTGAVDRVEIHPCRELVVDRDARRRAERALDHPSIRGQYRSLLERLVDGLTFEGMEQAIPLLYERLPFPADLLPASAHVVVAQARLTVDRAARVVAEADALA